MIRRANHHSENHKRNFLNNSKSCLLNPVKNEPGKISKIILDKKHSSRKRNRIQSMEKH